MTRKDWQAVALAIVAPVLVGLAVAAGCYATTGPTPTCSADPTQPWCPQPIHDERADAGR